MVHPVAAERALAAIAVGVEAYGAKKDPDAKFGPES